MLRTQAIFSWPTLYIVIWGLYPLFLSEFDETWIFLKDFSNKNTQISNFMKIHPVWTEFYHTGFTDGETDRYTTGLITAFRHFVNGPDE
jgi:hypothetical protein